MSPVQPAVTRVEMTQIVLPPHTNNHGTAFGGQIAAWADIAASVAARRFCRGPVVTVSMDSLHFLLPIKLGMIVVFRAQVNQAWRSSMEVGVRVEVEDSSTGERHRACSAYFTFVALDEQGRPKAVPALDPGEDAEDQRRAREAMIRRDARLRVRELLKGRPE